MAVISHSCTLSPDTQTPPKSNLSVLSEQTKPSSCHWGNAGRAGHHLNRTLRCSLWSLDNHQNKHLENSTQSHSKEECKISNKHQASGRKTMELQMERDLKAHLHPLPWAGTPRPGSSGVITCNENTTSPWELLENTDIYVISIHLAFAV